MPFRQCILPFAAVSMSAAMAGCGGSSMNTTPALPISVSFTSAAPASLQVNATASLAVAIISDSANAGVKWSVTCVSSGACGSFSTSGPGTSTIFTAPSTVPAGSTVTVMATSVTNPGDSLSIPIFVSLEPTTLANGSYVFQLSGTNAHGFYSVSGVFTVDNGSITGGEQDFIDPTTGAKNDTITGGSIVVIDDGNLWITLKTADTSIGVSGVETLDATLFSSSHATLIDFDSSGTSSGTVDLQTGIAAPSGGYAFFAFGRDSVNSATVIGGVLNVDGPGTISGNGSVFDINDAGLAGLDTSQTPMVHHFACYLVSPSQAVLIETDNAQLTLGFLELQK